MPDLIEKEKVEPFKLTKEHKAFLKNYKRINEVSAMIQKGLRIEFGKLQSLQQLANDVEGKRKELLLKKPEQGIREAADEGMFQGGSR